MPPTPTWYARLDQAIQELEALPTSSIDAATLALVLGIGIRRAQQLLAPLVYSVVGRTGLVPKEVLIEHLRRIASGDSAYYERQRRRRLSAVLRRLQEDWVKHPPLFVEAPKVLHRQTLTSLPVNIKLAPGSISIQGFHDSQEALQLLLTLVLAAGNSPDEFERTVRS